MAMQVFSGVTVGFPTGGGAMHTRDDWQSANWVYWSTGELRVDSESFSLVFSAKGCGRLAAKPLGCLVSAAEAMEPSKDGAATFMATTSDPVHSLLRLTFQNRGDEQAFMSLAHAAEVANPARYQGPGRRSSYCSRRSSAAAMASHNMEKEATVAMVREQHPGCWPLVFGGAELYGQDPRGQRGCEVLLGRGCVVLLDPREDPRRVGEYRLLFYEECSSESILYLPVCPRLRLVRQPDEFGPAATGRRLTTARRISMGGGRGSMPGCATPAFDLELPGASGWALAFDGEAEGEGFARDLSVRQKLVALSLKTAQGRSALSRLQGEMTDLRQSGIFAMIQRLVWCTFVFAFIALSLYACAIYTSDPERHLVDVAVTALQDASVLANAAARQAAEAGAAACGALMRAVPAPALEQCLALPDSMEAKSCVASLVS